MNAALAVTVAGAVTVNLAAVPTTTGWVKVIVVGVQELQVAVIVSLPVEAGDPP